MSKIQQLMQQIKSVFPHLERLLLDLGNDLDLDRWPLTGDLESRDKGDLVE